MATMTGVRLTRARRGGAGIGTQTRGRGRGQNVVRTSSGRTMAPGRASNRQLNTGYRRNLSRARSSGLATGRRNVEREFARMQRELAAARGQ